jgi:hypothetical protein
MLPTKFRIIWPSGFRGEEFKLEAQVSLAVWDLNSNLDIFCMQTFLRGLIYVR